MKKTLLFIISAILILGFTGCGKSASSPPSSSSESKITVEDKQDEKAKQDHVEEDEKSSSAQDKVFKIKEKMFIAQCNDIYLNPDDYLGQTIQIEGFCDIYTDPDTDETYYGVIRNGPGCCGNDGAAGFRFTYDGEYPKNNDWLEVTGKLENVDMGSYSTLLIRADTVNIKATRGADFVKN